MLIGEFGNSFKKTTKISYRSIFSIFDYDAIVVNFEAGVFADEGYLNESVIVRRKSDLQEFTKFKSIPIIYISPRSHVFTIENEYSRMNQVLHEIVPISEIEVEREIGSKIKINRNTPFSEFLEKYAHCFSYQSYFKKYSGTKIIETAHTQKVIAFFNNDYVVLPHIETAKISNEIDFFNDLLLVFENLRRNASYAALPQWAKVNYLLPNERELRDESKTISEKIESLEEEKVAKEQEIADFETQKILFTGTGNNLEDKVKQIFKELDFEVLEVEAGRDDLIVKYGDYTAVIEIKGVSKSAAEKHAAQLEKWVSDYVEKNDVIPKGILLVNAFKDLPLNERNEKAFPGQMLKYSIQREHCLITTLQLLGLYYDCINNPERKDEIIGQLFNTIGVLENYLDWRDFISFTE